MLLNAKKLRLRAFLLLLAVNILVYAVYHIWYLTDKVLWLGFIFQYVSEVVDMLFLAVCAVLMMILYAYSGLKSALPAGLLFFFTRTVYYLLFYYVDLVMYSSTPINSGDAILIAAVYTLILCLFGVVQTFAIFGIGLFVYKLRASCVSRGSLKESLKLSLGQHTMLDFELPLAVSLLAVSAFQFLFHVAFEIYDTVCFFMEYGGSYTTEELIYIIWRYLFYIIMFVLCHFITCFVKNYIFDKGDFLMEAEDSVEE